MDSSAPCTGFMASQHLAAGSLAEVALAAKAALHQDPASSVLIFSDHDARVIDVDLRGNSEAIIARLAERFPAPPAAGPGRPKLGVTAREVTLLPRHWEWLAKQPGGASATLRKLVEQARRSGEGPMRRRHAQEASYRFMSTMAGNEPGFEEAARALFGGNQAHFDAMVEPWPTDVRDYVRRLAQPAFEG